MVYTTYIQFTKLPLYLNIFSNCATSESGLLHSTVHVCLVLHNFVSRHIFPNPIHLLVIHTYIVLCMFSVCVTSTMFIAYAVLFIQVSLTLSLYFLYSPWRMTLTGESMGLVEVFLKL